ncbi:ABC transporter permease [Arthrobacter sp. zg-Y820]|uniref:ABC transporter permease n=1 Tax=unclassified Arthrobacter TaxID=235627 RepID=UPI001E4BB9C9|nr:MULTISPECIES: ABC transporter permease [unclassified Arthrobacter]MCC9197115.1 ABC transporter permease [Arthrobacter sp. zg-Y820]MDK1279980.1 ABC transporter permease [Arthrobacter sp. zg.Y820]WIB09279.1 ABC transporter permease [Arthrobacter sp. zg-Y820]
MTVGDILRSAVANTFRSKVRTALTVVAIFIGAFTLTLTSAIGAGVSDYIDKQVGAIGGDNLMTVSPTTEAAAEDDGPKEYNPDGAATQGNFTLLSDADIETILATEGIEKVEPAAMLAPDYIQYDGGAKFELTTNPMVGLADADLAAGRQLGEGTGAEMLIPSSYVEPLGFANADAALDQTVSIAVTDYAGTQHTVEAVIAGVQNDSLFGDGAGFNSDLRAELDALQRTGIPEGVSTGYITSIAFLDAGADEEQIAAVKADLEAQGFTGLTVADQIGAIQTVINGIIGVLNAFAVIALIAAGFGIVNTLLMSVQERTREIGLMKAMGMGGGKIFALFSFEAIFIGFLGSALGAGVAVGLGSIISSVLSNTVLSALPGLHIMLFTPASVATIIGVVMLIAFLAGTLPARRAAKQNPIDALRYE